METTLNNQLQLTQYNFSQNYAESGIFSDVSTNVSNNHKRPIQISTEECSTLNNDVITNADNYVVESKRRKHNDSIVLENTNCERTGTEENLFLARFQFREYDKERDLNMAPTVIYSRALDKRFVHDEHSKAPSILEMKNFEATGHTLAIDNIRSYVRLFSLDVDCVKCKSNGQITTSEHTTEININEILEKLGTIVNNTKIVFSVWSNKCGFHIYGNFNVSVLQHLYIRDVLSVRIANMQSTVVEVPDFMPLPYSSKSFGASIYKPLYSPVDGILKKFIVCTSLDSYEYQESFALKHLTPKNSEHLLLTIITSVGSEYVVFDKKRTVRNKLPCFLNAVSCDPHVMHSFAVDAAKYVDLIIKESTSVGHQGINIVELYTDVYLTNDLIQLQDLFDLAGDQFTIYFNAFSNKCFGESIELFTSSGLNDDFLKRYVYHSAIQFKGLNLQHYIVSLHKSVENDLDFDSFKKILHLLYEKELTNNCIRHTIEMYHPFILDLYPADYIRILNYMQLYVTESITPFMGLTEVFDKIISGRMGVNSFQFNEILRKAEFHAVKDWTFKFLDCLLKICKNYQFIVSYDSIVYYMETDSFVYSPLTKKLEFCSSWHIDMRKILEKIQNETKSFQVSRFCESNKYMTATGVGVFNSISGLYFSKSPLIPFTKYRYSMLWPKVKNLNNEQRNCYEEINEDILKKRPIVQRILREFSENIDSMFINFHFIPSMVGLMHIDYCWDVSGMTICNFFEHLKYYKDLSEALPVVELFAFDLPFVMFIIVLLNDHSLQVITDYKKLIKCLFASNTDVASVSRDRWRKIFKLTFNVDYENAAKVMFSITDKKKTYAKRLMSYKHTNPDIYLTEQNIIIGVCLTKALSRCKQFTCLFEAFDQTSPKTTRHANPELLNMNCNSSYENMSNIYQNRLKKLVYNPKDQFELRIANVCLHLCKSSAFIPDTFRELLNIFSASMVPINIKKKIYILFGQRDCGKSYLLDLIELNARPSTKSILKLDENEEKTGIASTNLIIRCNELAVLNVDQVKSITGDDPKSQRIFHTQNYLNGQSGQSLLYAATNGIVLFKNNYKREIIDSAMVNRFHVIKLRCQYVSTNDKISGTDSIFAMTANHKYYTENVKSSIYAPILQWVLFENYVNTRNPINFEPYLNINHEDCLDYKQQVYLNNCPIYAFLTKCGFSEEEGFFISPKTLLSVVSRNFIDKAEAKIASNDIKLTMTQFYNMFKNQYGMAIERENGVIPNLQFTTLIRHIKYNMQIREDPDKRITSQDLEKHLSVYTFGVDRDNAREYFKKLIPNVKNHICTKNVIFESDDDDDNDSGNNASNENCTNLYEKTFYLDGWTFTNEETLSYDFDSSDNFVTNVNTFINEEI